MAFRVFSEGFSQSIDQVTMDGSFDGAQTSPGTDAYFEYGYASFNNLSPSVHDDGSVGTWSRSVSVNRDVSFKFRAVADDGTGIERGGNIHLKTFAAGATYGVPSSSGITQIEAAVACLIAANTVESSGTVIVEYRVVGTLPTTETVILATMSGAGASSIGTTLTGLTPATDYEFRFRMDRDTSNEQQSFSEFSTFTTLSGSPTAVTGVATGIGSNSATLNGVVNAGGGSTNCFFHYGLTAAYGSVTAVEVCTGSVDTPISAVISGLVVSTLYHFRVVSNGGATVGADATFSTVATPAAGSPEDEDVIYPLYAQYGLVRTVYFSLKEPAATNSDRFITAAAPFVAGDVKISKDGAAFANVNALPVQIAGALYAWTSTAAEMQAIQAEVLLIDQNGPVWRDAIIRIETTMALGKLDVVNPLGSAMVVTSSGTNGSGIAASGNGSGSGFLGTAGASGQICNLFDTLEGAEPTGPIASIATYKQILQYIKRRFFNKRTQSGILQTMLKDDSLTTLQSAGSSDDGAVQTINKYV